MSHQPVAKKNAKSGQVTVPTVPVAATDAASKDYVDTEITAAVNTLAGGDGITVGFVSGTNASGYTTVVTKTTAFFATEDVWYDLTDEFAELLNSAQGLSYDAVNDEVDVPTAGRYLVILSVTFERRTGTNVRIFLGGIGINGADPTAPICSEYMNDDINNMSGTQIMTLGAADTLKVYLKQVTESTASTSEIDFAMIMCTIVRIS